MDAQAILGVSTVVVALVQLLKASPLPTTGLIPVILVVLLSAIAVLLWGVSHEDRFARALIWDYFSGWAAVTLTAAGAYGIVRSAGTQVMSATTHR